MRYLSRELIDAIRAANIGQREIVDRVGGMSQAKLSTWLNGRHVQYRDAARIEAIAALVGVPPERATSPTFEGSLPPLPRLSPVEGEVVSVTVPTALLDEFDDECDRRGMTRSALLMLTVRGCVAAGRLERGL